MAAIALLAAHWRYRARSRQDLNGLRELVEREQTRCADLFLEVKRNLADLEEESLQNAPKPGALSRSKRAEAMRLLRSGLSIEAAASSLGIGKREMRLLERVSQTLMPV